MKGRTGLSGTLSLPFWMEILAAGRRGDVFVGHDR